MSEKKDLKPNEEELDIIAGVKVPTKEELKQIREKFKDDSDIIEALEDAETLD